MENPNIKLSSTEIASLWSTYIYDSASICFFKHFLQHLKDEEIIPIVNEALNFSETHMKKIENIFKEEKFPIPQGFSDIDINYSAPALFDDLYALSFVYGMSRIGLLNYGILTSNVARDDVLELFSQILNSMNGLYKKSVRCMLSKGIYDRPPKIPYPHKVEFVEKQSFLTGWFGQRRPINSMELTEVFFNIERNYFGILLLYGLIQVVDDKVIKQYLERGKDLANKQIYYLNNLLKEEDLFGTVPVEMEVTDSKVSPFSEKLIMFLVTTLNATSFTYFGHALSVSMRRDLTANYSKLLTEVMTYAEDGFNIMIDRGWMEKPPGAFQRP
ncbi:sugar isomerase [Bacillus sp. SA1-12]|uniref:DUF3231 family protein n=1 Tax=Bacillus sp. SA1-12 TaxID=1455638 RepID=UPI000625D55D|nr:DUF3231 family protein [Bacillus sp. SA1-12]KKI92116.1 sugar isomerase [Bacillus sp. SA1-12]